MLPPMAVNWYKNITREDLNAIVAYRRTLKPLPAVPQGAPHPAEEEMRRSAR